MPDGARGCMKINNDKWKTWCGSEMQLVSYNSGFLVTLRSRSVERFYVGWDGR